MNRHLCRDCCFYGQCGNGTACRYFAALDFEKDDSDEEWMERERKKFRKEWRAYAKEDDTGRFSLSAVYNRNGGGR